MLAINLVRAGEARITMIHKNIPDMVGQVSHILGKSGANIIHMVNNSRDGVAVTLMDVEASIDEATESELSNIDGMLK